MSAYLKIIPSVDRFGPKGQAKERAWELFTG